MEGLIHGWWKSAELTDKLCVCSDSDAALVCCGEDKPECEGEAVDSLVDLHSYSYL